MQHKTDSQSRGWLCGVLGFNATLPRDDSALYDRFYIDLLKTIETVQVRANKRATKFRNILLTQDSKYMHYHSCIENHVIDFMSSLLDRHADNLDVPDQPFPCIARYMEYAQHQGS